MTLNVATAFHQLTQLGACSVGEGVKEKAGARLSTASMRRSAKQVFVGPRPA